MGAGNLNLGLVPRPYEKKEASKNDSLLFHNIICRHFCCGIKQIAIGHKFMALILIGLCYVKLLGRTTAIQ